MTEGVIQFCEMIEIDEKHACRLFLSARQPELSPTIPQGNGDRTGESEDANRLFTKYLLARDRRGFRARGRQTGGLALVR
jgi:hypothetical protein